MPRNPTIWDVVKGFQTESRNSWVRATEIKGKVNIYPAAAANKTAEEKNNGKRLLLMKDFSKKKSKEFLKKMAALM